MRTLAYHDPLTGLPNRLLFHDRLQLAVAQAHRSRERLAVLFVDLDGFKLINDSLGHEVGDRVLEKVSERLVSCVREGDTVARLGGDEFTLILPGLHRIDELPPLAEKVLEVLRRPLRAESRELYVTASMGVSLYPDDGEDAATLVKNADTAMYRAKEQGRDQCQLYAPSMNVSAVERLAEENNLRRALMRNELAPLFRPMVDLATGNVFGVEALVRWPPASEGAGEGGSRSPADLASFMVPIAPWLVRTACRQVVQWQEAGLSGLRVAVRLSARQFRQVDLIPDVQLALAEAGLDPHCLELDVTDTSALPQAHAAARGLRRAARAGGPPHHRRLRDRRRLARRPAPAPHGRLEDRPRPRAAPAQEPRGRRRGHRPRGPRPRPAPGGGGRGHRGRGPARLPGRARMRPPARRPVAPAPGREGVPGAAARGGDRALVVTRWKLPVTRGKLPSEQTSFPRALTGPAFRLTFSCLVVGRAVRRPLAKRSSRRLPCPLSAFSRPVRWPLHPPLPVMK